MINFDCPNCKTPLSVEDEWGGKPAKCPKCGVPLTVPAGQSPSAPAAAAPLPFIFCAKCGQKNDQNNYKCLNCGAILHQAPRPVYTVESDNTMGGLVPYKNGKALTAYYLGIFSLLCAPLGIASFVLGIQGLKYASAHPEAKGKAHAWVGIIAGGLTGLALVIGIIALVVSISASK